MKNHESVCCNFHPVSWKAGHFIKSGLHENEAVGDFAAHNMQ